MVRDYYDFVMDMGAPLRPVPDGDAWVAWFRASARADFADPVVVMLDDGDGDGGGGS